MAGLLQIATEPESGKSLKDELEGLKSFRISRFRIIYRISSKQTGESLLVRLGGRLRDNDGRPV
jgi:mRNA-degrading endonuclease RelE of RelBE toxin-antitoxin system